MFESKEPDSKLKLIDFGLSRSYLEVSEDEEEKIVRMQTRAGTAFFMAPEVVKRNYT